MTALVARRRAARRRSASIRDRTARSPTRCRRTCAGRTRRCGRPPRDQVGQRASRRTRRSACRPSTRSWSSTIPATGLPVAILDGGPITAQRTAAVSGVAIGHGSARTRRATARGAHRSGCPGPQPPRRSSDISSRASSSRSTTVSPSAPTRSRPRRATTPGIASAEVAATARDAVAGADVVITAASFAPPSERQSMTNDWLAPDALVVASRLRDDGARRGRARRGPVPVDERGQFLANRDAGQFDGYPDPTATLGEAILAGHAPCPTTGASSSATSGSGSRTWSSPTRSCAARRRWASAWTCPGDQRPRRRRRRDDGRLDRAARAAGRPGRDAHRCLRGRQPAGDLRRRDPHHALVPRRRHVLRDAGRVEARDAWHRARARDRRALLSSPCGAALVRPSRGRLRGARRRRP